MTDFQKYQERLKFIEYLAEHKRTGTSKALAQKLGVSVRTAKRMIRHLKDNGVNIKFDKLRQTYFLDK
jgi:predicted DNA-binding transcriptional regulator YafY